MSEIRYDGSLVNALTGLGTTRDKSSQTFVGIADVLTQEQQMQLAQDVFIGRVCSAKPDAATRKWCEVTYTDKDDEVIKAFNQYRDTVGGKSEDEELISDKELFMWAGYLANVHRGSAIIMDVEDGRSPSEPINTKAIKTIRSCEVLDSWKIYPDLSSTLNPFSATHYEILVPQNQGPRLQGVLDKFHQRKNGDFAYRVHRSRILRIPGVRIPPDLMLRNLGWDRSLIEQIWTTFRDWMSTYQNVNSLIHDYSLFVYGLKGLRDMVTEGQEDQLRTRFRLFQTMASSMGGVAIDNDGESVNFVQRQFSGLDQLMDKFRDLFIGAADIPHTMLFGESPSGLGATGESEEKTWASTVAEYQSSVILPRLRRLYRLIWLAEDGPTNGEEPEGWQINFLPLYEQSESERLAGLSSFTGALATVINAGVILPEEARIPFKGDTTSFNIVLDEDLWEQKKEEESQAFDFGGGFGAEEQPTEEGAAPPPEEEQPLDPAEEDIPTLDSYNTDEAVFADKKLHEQIVSEAKKKFKVYPSRYAGYWISQQYRKRYSEKHGSTKGLYKGDSHMSSVRVSLNGDLIQTR